MIEIKDGLAYEDEKPIILHVIEISTLPGYKLSATFQNGEVKIYDFKHLLTTPAFEGLKDQKQFEKVTLDHGIPTWEETNVDLSPETIYKNGIPA